MSEIPLSPELMLGVSIVFIPTSTIVLLLRFIQRRKQKAGYTLDDWLMIPAYVCVMAMQVTLIIETVKHQLGYPDPLIIPGGDAKSNHQFYPVEVEQIPAIGLIKLSLLLFYQRIFIRGAPKWFRWASRGMIGVIIGWIIAFLLVWIFLCKPNASSYWQSSAIEKSKCVETQKLHNALAISDAIIDFIVVLMALPVIWGLHLTFARKVAVTACFLLGLVTVAASVTRMVIFIKITAVRYAPHVDVEHINSLCLYWSMIETGLAFLVANLMVLYGLFASITKHSVESFRRLLPGTLKSGNSDSSTYTKRSGWPPRQGGDVEIYAESSEFSILNSKASHEADVPYKIRATTTLEQSAQRV